MSRVIEADPDRLWKALTRPDEIVTWDARMLAPVDPSDDYPFTSGGVRWRYMLGGIQVVMHDRPLEIGSVAPRFAFTQSRLVKTKNGKSQLGDGSC